MTYNKNMIQKDIYRQDIFRTINGVIKAGSIDELDDEIREYVITKEQMQPQMLPRLFKCLSEPKVKQCVWISGDFGSGKSHLLKILSYVLENKGEIDGESYGEIFSKKVEDDFELSSDIKKSCRISNESVLFNIQEKLDGIGKGAIDSVLNIFLKEFNRKLGYDDKKPEIAEIERYIDNKGKYAWFKSEYKQRFGKDWASDRPSILFKLQNLAKLFTEIEGIDETTAYQNLKTQIDNYKLDTDGFIKLLNQHLDEQTPGSRFIFFVDEVGQFIGKDVQRMLSLQTIAEGLSDKTNGRAIMMVTSQMDIDATLGNLEKQQEYDFSRIQGRFTIRINLTSANADEVIQRRLLEKKPEAEKVLIDEYESQKNIIKSLFQFGDESQFKNTYKSAGDFAIDFPFIDYQFDLLQSCIIELSKNNAFSGRQQSVGERSLLTIAQEVAKVYANENLVKIVQFSDMYEGIKGILQTKIMNDIIQAEKTLENPLALKVLKTLFMLKYVKGFPTTLDNITKLQMPTLDTDFHQLKSEVQEALNTLVRLSYIEKGAKDDYHFQTNEEKDIETEIKNEELAPDAIERKLKQIFHDSIFPQNKINISNNVNFEFGRIVDEKFDGKERDINIHFITPLNTMDSTDSDVMERYSLQHPTQLCVVLDEDRYLADDLVNFLRADRCLSRLLTSNTDQYRGQIITDKRRVNAKREENVEERLNNLSKTARLYLAGQELDIKSSDIKTRLTEGMKNLVKTLYYNLDMLEVEYDDNALRNILDSTTNGAFYPTEMDNAMVEVFNKITANKRLSVRTKVSDLIKEFNSGNYGWPQIATLSILAKLYKLDKISFRRNGSIVDDIDLYRLLTNRDAQDSLIIDIEEAITNSQMATMKGFYKELFNDETCVVNSPKEVHTAFNDRLKKEISLLKILTRENRYEFVKPVNDTIERLEKLSGYVFPSLYNRKEEIEEAIDSKVDCADIIAQFIDSPQFKIFEKLAKAMEGIQANMEYVDEDLVKALTEAYNSPEPWKLMSDTKTNLKKLEDEIKTRQQNEREKVLQLLDSKIEALKSLPQLETLKSVSLENLINHFEKYRNKIQYERFIGNIIAFQVTINNDFNGTIDKINYLVEQQEKEEKERIEREKLKAQQKGVSAPQPPSYQAKTSKKVVGKAALDITYTKNILSTKEDVEKYVEELKKHLLQYIDNNTDIILN